MENGPPADRELPIVLLLNVSGVGGTDGHRNIGSRDFGVIALERAPGSVLDAGNHKSGARPVGSEQSTRSQVL
ncbi:hypothetical protein RhoFasSB10_01623 [Rhodococcus fascians]|nr:hypothetical protein [Rhodococcus fascians]